MLPVKLKLVSIKNILSRWLHIGCLASHIIFTCWPTQRVGLSHFCFFFTGQLNVLAYLILFFIFLLPNSTCWPFIIQPDGSHRLLLVAFPHARKIFLEVLAIDGYRGCWPLTAIGNLAPSNSSSMYAFPGRT